MQSRSKIGMFVTITITLLLGFIWTMPVSADHVPPVATTSQSTRSSTADSDSHANGDAAGTAAKPSPNDNDSRANKSSQNSAPQSSSNQVTTDTNSPKNSSSTVTSTTKATTTNNQQTSTVTVPVVSSKQQGTSQAATATGNAAKIKNVKKKVTLTTPNSTKVTKHQELSQVSLLPQTGKGTWLLAGGAVALVWMPAIVVIFNTLI